MTYTADRLTLLLQSIATSSGLYIRYAELAQSYHYRWEFGILGSLAQPWAFSLGNSEMIWIYRQPEQATHSFLVKKLTSAMAYR